MTNVVDLKQPKNGALEALKQRYVRVPSHNGFPRFRDLKTGTEQADLAYLEHFYRQHSNASTPFKAPGELADALVFLHGESFLPGGPALLAGGLQNLWQAPPIKASGAIVRLDAVKPFTEFLKRLFPIKEELHFFLWWLAHIVRHPENRITATPVLRSEHGVGKGFLIETLIAGLIGVPSTAVCHLKDVVGDFNDVLEGKTLVMVDEVYGAKLSQVHALKSLQGNATFALRRKYRPTVTIPNFLSFVISSNDHIPLTIEKGDRRFWVPQFIKHKIGRKETNTFINQQLKPWLLNGGLQLVRDFLETIRLDLFCPTGEPPMTDGKQELFGFTTVDRLKGGIGELLAELPVVTVASIRNHLTDDSFRGVSDRVIASMLLGLDCLQKKTTNARFYITPIGVGRGLSLASTPRQLQQALLMPLEQPSQA